MPRTEWFAYTFPNRRSDRPVVEVTLRFLPADLRHASMDVAPIRRCLEIAGIVDAAEAFPATALPGDYTGWFASVLAQTA
ncbi:MAG: hypothetical protein PVJ71_05940, partial [Lysobacterales bacterium]